MNNESKRILITGGTGMVGANLIDRLVIDGHRISLLVRDNPDRIRLRPFAGRISVYQGNVTDAAAVRQAIKQADPEIVYHLASTPFNPPTIGAAEHMQAIVMGALNLLEGLAERSSVRVVYTGSAAEYGGGLHLSEDAPLMPGTILGAAKAAAGILMQTYTRLYGIETVGLRLFTPYGRWESPSRLIPHTILSALDGRDVAMSQGKQQRDYTYIDDVVDALVLAGTRPVTPGAVFNICSGVGRPVIGVVELTLELMGNRVSALVGALPTRPDEIMEMSGDITAAREVLDWQPRTSLEDGLEKTIAWFTDNRELVGSLT